MLILAIAPYVVAGIFLIGILIFAAHVQFHGFKLKDDWIEPFVYVLCLALVFWLLKMSGWWSRAALGGLCK